MRTERQQEKIKNVQAQCEMHWLANRIPQDRSEEMADELGQHLEEAMQDGKTVEDVVGPDVYAFAESLAKEERPTWTVKDRVVEYVFALSFMAAFVATIFHLFRWELFIPVHWFVVPELLIFAWLASRPFRGPISQDARPKWKRWLWPVVAALFVVVAWSIGQEMRPIIQDADFAVTGNANGTIFVWPWYGTVAAVAINVIFGRLRKGGAGSGD